MKYVSLLWVMASIGCGSQVTVPATAGGGGSSSTTAVTSATTTGSSGACDGDGDGFEGMQCGGSDCDDGDAAVHPGALDDPPGPWQAAIIDSEGDTGWSASVAVDELGTVHASYVRVGYSVHYARLEQGIWSFEALGPTPYSSGGMGMSAVCVDPDGNVHVSFVEEGIGLVLATRSGDTWTRQIVDEGDVEHSSLACADDGRVVQGYLVGRLRVAIHEEGGTTIHDIDPEAAVPQPTIAIDHTGGIHVAYTAFADAYTIRYARMQASGWSVEDVSVPGTLNLPGLAIDAAGVPHITFTHYQDGFFHAQRKSGGWQLTHLDPQKYVGAFSRLMLGADGRLRMAHMKNGLVHYSVFDGTAWQGSAIFQDDDLSAGAHLGLAMEPSGVAHIVSRSSSNGWKDNQLHYVSNRAAPDGIDNDCDGHEW